jgi:hypothetical protein
MLLVDDVLTAPLKGLIWIFDEVRKAALEAQQGRRDEIMTALSALYVALEQGRLDEDGFEAQEQALLDELDALDAAIGSGGDDEAEPEASAALDTRRRQPS